MMDTTTTTTATTTSLSSPIQSYSLPSPTSPSSTSSNTSVSKKRSSKSHVPTACVNCKKAHLACDLSRPCKRCVTVGKTDSCYDIQHKKRGRPKLRDKRTSASSSAWKHDKNEKQRSTHPHTNHHHNHVTSNNNCSGNTALATTMAMTVAPAIAPGIANSSFTMTQPPGYQQPEEQTHSMMTIFLSMDMRCARVSDEAFEYLGLYPQQLAHRSLYDFLTSTNGLENIHRCLLDTTTNRPVSKITTTSEQFVTVSPTQLLSIANGSQTFKETLHFKQPNGSSYFDPLEARFYLGGGLGADLFVPSSLDRLYVVCLLTVKQRSATIAAATTSNTDDALALLNEATADIRPITPKQREQLLPQDELSAVTLGDPQQAFHQPWTTATSTHSPSISSSMDHTVDAFKLCDTNVSSSSSNSTTTTTSSSTTALTERWNSDDETQHQLVWMQPHDFVYAPQQQQQTKLNLMDYTKTSTPTTPFSNTTTTATIPASWNVDQSDMTSIFTSTEYENMMRDIK